MTDLHIQILGDFRLLADGQPVMTLNTPRLQAFITYLLLFREAPQLRQQLAFQFWPDSSEAQARTNLRNLLHQFRRALPEADDFIHIDRQTLQWNPESPFSLDLGSYESALQRAEAARDPEEEQRELQQAVDLYRGDLLPGCYEDWILPEQERLREAFTRALERLVKLAEDRRDYPAAIQFARRILRQDPLHEVTYRQLMRLHALDNDPAGALRTYHACASVLAKELGVAPGPETRSAYERLLNLDDQPQDEPLATRTPLVGRQVEWSALQRRWRGAAAGRAQMALLTGEAGIGKTRLAQELIDWAARQGIQVLSARCYAPEGRLAYAPIIEWLKGPALWEALPQLDHAWLQEISRLLPDLRQRFPDLQPPLPLIESWQRQRVYEALARGFLAVPQPLLLFLDNVHWADPDTLEWLHYLLRFEPQARLLILGTLREEETTPEEPLQVLRIDLRHQGLLAEIPLGRLREDETLQLARQALGRELDAELRSSLFRETEGNPLFVMELSRARRLQRGELTPRLQAVIERRLSLLSPQARELAGLAATIGRAFTFEVLAGASPLEEDELVQALDELWSRRVVHEQGLEAYDFAHERLRDVAYQGQSAARRRLNHKRAASALARIHQHDLDAVSGRIGAHFASAGQMQEAVIWHRRAAEAARRLYANQQAIDHYRQILGILDQHPDAGGALEHPDTAKLDALERLGEAQDLVGRHEDAWRNFQAALALTAQADGLHRAKLEWQMGQCRHKAYQHEEALRHYARAEAILNPIGDRSGEWWKLWIDVQQARIWAHYRLADLEQMQDLVDRLAPQLQTHGTAPQRAEFYGFRVAANNLRNRFVVGEEDVAFARMRLEAAGELDSELELARAHFSLGFELLWFGDLAEAESHLKIALDVFERIGYRLMEARCLTYLTTLYRLKSDAEAAREHNQRNQDLVRDLNSPDYLGMTLAHEAWLAWRSRELEQADRLVRAALETWDAAPNYPIQWAALWPALALAHTRQDRSSAAAHARRLLSEGQQRLADPIMEQLAAFLEDYVKDGETGSGAHLAKALRLAEEHGFL